MSSNYQPEAAIWCALAWVILIARLASRRMRLGAWGSLELEDALAVLAVLLATAMMALLDEYMRNVDALFKFSKTKGLAAKGLKLLFAAEQMQILSIWITKAGMLLLYYRLTGLTDKRKQVIGTAVYVACAFVLVELLFFVAWCRPFSDYFNLWAKNLEQCSYYTHHYIAHIVLNVSSDILILLIPMPLLYNRSRGLGFDCTRRLQAVLVIIVLMGGFTIGAAVASKVIALTVFQSYIWMQWYNRETFTAILCANLPRLTPLFLYMVGVLRQHHVSIIKSNTGNQNHPSYGNTRAPANISLGPSNGNMSRPEDAHTKDSMITTNSSGFKELDDLEIQRQPYV